MEQQVCGTKDVDAAELGKLTRLRELGEIFGHVYQDRFRRPAAIILVVTALIFVFLELVKSGPINVRLNAKVNGVRFQSTQAQFININWSLDELGVEGLDLITFPHAQVSEETLSRGDGRPLAVKLAVVEGQKGQISLGPLDLPGGAEVSIRWFGTPQQYHLTFSKFKQPLVVAISGALEVNATGSPGFRAFLGSPRPVTLYPSTTELQLDLTLNEMTPRGLMQFSVSDLRLEEDERYREGQVLLRPVSTILEGALFFEEIDGKERELSPGEVLTFDAQGALTLQFEHEVIDLSFQGQVENLRTGASESQMNLMPSLLERFTAGASWRLYAGATIFVVGMVAAVFRTKD